MPATCTPFIGLTSSVTERSRESCRLDDEEAFSVFSRCCYAIKLYGIEQSIFPNFRMIFETSPALDSFQRAQIENNALLQEAKSIDALLFKVVPDLTKETVEFHNTHSKSKQLQKPAKIL
jgi:hypothetical protein